MDLFAGGLDANACLKWVSFDSSKCSPGGLVDKYREIQSQDFQQDGTGQQLRLLIQDELRFLYRHHSLISVQTVHSFIVAMFPELVFAAYGQCPVWWSGKNCVSPSFYDVYVARVQTNQKRACPWPPKNSVPDPSRTIVHLCSRQGRCYCSSFVTPGICYAASVAAETCTSTDWLCFTDYPSLTLTRHDPPIGHKQDVWTWKPICKCFLILRTAYMSWYSRHYDTSPGVDAFLIRWLDFTSPTQWSEDIVCGKGE